MRDKFNVVVGLDFSELGELAFREACMLAAGRVGAVIHIAHALTSRDLESGDSDMEQQEAAFPKVARKVWDIVERALQKESLPLNVAPIWQHVRIGKPGEVIRQVAVDYDADMIVVGSHGRVGLERVLAGSVSKWLVDHAHAPLLVVRPNTLSGLEKTERIAPEPPAGTSMDAGRGDLDATHVYVSTMRRAWAGMGRPTDPFTPTGS